MELGLRGRVALVGGGSRGIGLAVARALAVEGCALMLWSSNQDRLNDAALNIRAEYGVVVETVVGDATDPQCGESVAAECLSTFREVDIFVMNSGGPPVADPTNTTPDPWISSLQSLLVTQVRIATLLLPGMRDRGWGRLLALLSSGVRQPIPDLPYSNSGRIALAAWLKSCAPVVARQGVTANGIVIGRIDTERAQQLDSLRAQRRGTEVEVVRSGREDEIPMGRYGRPDELASLAAFLCSEKSSYITGALIPADGGLLSAI